MRRLSAQANSLACEDALRARFRMRCPMPDCAEFASDHNACVRISSAFPDIPAGQRYLLRSRALWTGVDSVVVDAGEDLFGAQFADQANHGLDCCVDEELALMKSRLGRVS